MRFGALGKEYADGECIVAQGEVGNCMYVMQKGKARVLLEREQGDVPLATLTTGDIFGEMALFTKAPRSATVRADGKARVLTIDKRGFMKRIHEDPSLAFRILKKMAERVQDLNQELSRLTK